MYAALPMPRLVHTCGTKVAKMPLRLFMPKFTSKLSAQPLFASDSSAGLGPEVLAGDGPLLSIAQTSDRTSLCLDFAPPWRPGT